jgi:hypothetical protein
VLFVGAAWSCKRGSLWSPFLVDWTLRAKKNTTIWSCQIVSNRTAKRPVAACLVAALLSRKSWAGGCHFTQDKQQTNTAWVTHLSTRGEQFRGHFFVAVRAERFLLTTADILIVVRGISITLSVINSAILFNKKTTNIQSICCFICDYFFLYFMGLLIIKITYWALHLGGIR